MICFAFVMKSPEKGVIVTEKLGKARNENGEENHPVNKLHELIVRISINYIIIMIIIIIIYHQSECIDKYQIELCSKYDREYDFDVILKTSRTLAQVEVDVASMQMMLCDKTILSRDITSMSHWELRYTMTGKQVDAMIDAFLDCLPVKYNSMAHHFCCIRPGQ